MKGSRLAIALMFGLSTCLFFALASQGQEPPKKEVESEKKNQDPPGLAKSKLRPREGKLQVGDLPPDLHAADLEGKKTVKLRQLQGKPVVLIFGSCT